VIVLAAPQKMVYWYRIKDVKVASTGMRFIP